jgi:hypothetical protein
MDHRYYDRCGNPVDPMYWSLMFEESDRHVGDTTIGDVRVSTVFLGLNHQYESGGPPLIFETMVFGGPLDDEMDRYSTEAEAEAGHVRMVDRVRAAITAGQGTIRSS